MIDPNKPLQPAPAADEIGGLAVPTNPLEGMVGRNLFTRIQLSHAGSLHRLAEIETRRFNRGRPPAPAPGPVIDDALDIRALTRPGLQIVYSLDRLSLSLVDATRSSHEGLRKWLDAHGKPLEALSKCLLELGLDDAFEILGRLVKQLRLIADGQMQEEPADQAASWATALLQIKLIVAQAQVQRECHDDVPGAVGLSAATAPTKRSAAPRRRSKR